MLRSSSICTSFLYNYLVSSDDKDKGGDKLTKDAKRLRCLSNTLKDYGGVLSKLSQILCLDDKDNNVFSECKPFSKEKTIKFFKRFIINSDLPVNNVDFNVYKSGSIGQVHKAVYEDKKIVFKVQYVGLQEQVKCDLKILDKVASYLFYFSDIKNAMKDIKLKMNEELDYELEKNNQDNMYKLFKKTKYVKIPKVISELSNDKILAMYYIEGKSLKDFIDNSTQDERNVVGENMIKFVFESLYSHNILYSDCHYGNFLVTQDFNICVLDFGCIHYVGDELMDNMRSLHLALLESDKDRFYELVETIGIIDKKISEKSRAYIYDYFKIQYEPWISDEFEFTDEWLDTCSDKDTDLMKEWKLPDNMVYFNKIPYGFYHILTKMKLQGSFLNIFKNILNKDE